MAGDMTTYVEVQEMYRVWCTKCCRYVAKGLSRYEAGIYAEDHARGHEQEKP